MKRIVIATLKTPNILRAENLKASRENKYDINIITDKQELSEQNLEKIKPDFIFFPHWSWIIPNEIIKQYKCVVFHTGRLPKHRGGSPIQNQIINKEYNSQVCAIAATNELDGGNIYLREEISLSDGNIDEILNNISEIIFKKMIPQIIEEDIITAPQQGEASYFSRRTPEMSEISGQTMNDLVDYFDFIRMLDGAGYPKAFLNLNEKFKMDFSKVEFDEKGKKLRGTFEIYEK